MKKWQKVAVSAVTILSIAALATGCSAGKKKGNTTENKGAVKVSFSWWGNDDRHKATQDMITNFEKDHKDISL